MAAKDAREAAFRAGHEARRKLLLVDDEVVKTAQTFLPQVDKSVDAVLGLHFERLADIPYYGGDAVR
jgi:hypothetical protein